MLVLVQYDGQTLRVQDTAAEMVLAVADCQGELNANQYGRVELKYSPTYVEVFHGCQIGRRRRR